MSAGIRKDAAAHKSVILTRVNVIVLQIITAERDDYIGNDVVVSERIFDQSWQPYSGHRTEPDVA